MDVNAATQVQNLRTLAIRQALQALFNQLQVLLHVVVVLLGTLVSTLSTEHLGGQVHGLHEAVHVRETHTYGGHTGVKHRLSLLLAGDQNHVRLSRNQLLHVEVVACGDGGGHLSDVGVHLTEPGNGGHVVGGCGKLGGTTEGQQHLVVCMPQVSHMLGGHRNGNLLAVDILNDLSTVTVILHEEAGVVLSRRVVIAGIVTAGC